MSRKLLGTSPHSKDSTQCKVGGIDLVRPTPWELNWGLAQHVELWATSQEWWHQLIELTLVAKKNVWKHLVPPLST
jgi:hypothetical protein